MRTIPLPPLVVDDDDRRPTAYFVAPIFGIRLEDIAAIAGVTEGYVSHVFNGRRSVTQRIVDATVEAFGGRYTAEELFDETKQKDR